MRLALWEGLAPWSTPTIKSQLAEVMGAVRRVASHVDGAKGRRSKITFRSWVPLARLIAYHQLSPKQKREGGEAAQYTSEFDAVALQVCRTLARREGFPSAERARVRVLEVCDLLYLIAPF